MTNKTLNLKPSILLVIVACCSCSQPAPKATNPVTKESSTTPMMASEKPIKNSSDDIPIQTTRFEKLLHHHDQWRGTRYRLGGTDKKGIDCSGFVQMTYHHLFNKQLPRTTLLQAAKGQTIERHELTTGDLIFFKYSRSFRHVGIYMGNNQFLHASTSKGVTISSLNNNYWNKRYWKAKRIL